MSEYTPTTEDVRRAYSTGATNMQHGYKQSEFDRWLAFHEAVVRAKEAEQWAQAVITSGKQGERIGLARAAGVVADETGWEYGFMSDGDSEPWTDLSDDIDYLVDATGSSISSTDRIVRRRKAGPWVPVE